MRMIDADDTVMRLREAEKDMKVVSVLGCKAIDFAVVPQFIEGMPTIDAVPVVRCKDCKHWGGRHGMNECSLITTITEPTYWAKTQPDDFCSSGERRGE